MACGYICNASVKSPLISLVLLFRAGGNIKISGKIPLKSQNHGKCAEIDGEIPTNYLKNMQMDDFSI